SERDALAAVRSYLSYLPSNWRQQPPPSSGPAAGPQEGDLAAGVPASERQAFDMRRCLRGLVDAGSLFEIHQLWARELTVGFARLAGQVIGVGANNPMVKGGGVFGAPADKGARGL